MKTNNKGFSLVELIVVIAIMAILAAVAIPTFAGFIGKAQVNTDETLLNDLQYAVNLAKVEYDMDVTSEDGALSVVIDANGKVTAVKLGGDTIYSATVSTSNNTVSVTVTSDEYKLGDIVDLDGYTFKKITGTTTPKGDGHWNYN